MKTIVAIACVAVIAFVGYFFWEEWRSSEAVRVAQGNALYADCLEHARNVPTERDLLVMSQIDRDERLAKTEECLAILQSN